MTRDNDDGKWVTGCELGRLLTQRLRQLKHPMASEYERKCALTEADVEYDQAERCEPKVIEAGKKLIREMLKELDDNG